MLLYSASSHTPSFCCVVAEVAFSFLDVGNVFMSVKDILIKLAFEMALTFRVSFNNCTEATKHFIVLVPFFFFISTCFKTSTKPVQAHFD